MERSAKIQIIVAAIAAVVLLVTRSRVLVANAGVIPESLEAFSFLLCATAVASSGKAVRDKYQELGFNKRVARQSSDYVKMRQSVRWWLYPAVLIMATLAAPRLDFPIWWVVGVLAVAYPPAMLIVDRMSGWTGPTIR